LKACSACRVTTYTEHANENDVTVAALQKREAIISHATPTT